MIGDVLRCNVEQVHHATCMSRMLSSFKTTFTLTTPFGVVYSQNRQFGHYISPLLVSNFLARP